MMVKKIEQYFQYFGVAPKIQEVSLKVLPAVIQKLDIPVTPHNSYKTAADYVLNLHELGFDELHYVLGISNDHCLFGKAVIRVGDHYYDPTVIARHCFLPKDQFVSIYEMPMNELKGFMAEHNNEMPSILNLEVVEMLKRGAKNPEL
ncbi:hypothetical protein ACTL6P_00215 [Endozoicomonas acroporae]|uniref:hypothetical protein n=1 Tax=Endozoicomonas acroporae TaxID=1701104 RepID=UPI000C76BB0A|nr:hypothetical protein [Endozoicomonas acroporae]